jgi:hypothetical protein
MIMVLPKPTGGKGRARLPEVPQALAFLFCKR